MPDSKRIVYAWAAGTVTEVILMFSCAIAGGGPVTTGFLGCCALYARSLLNDAVVAYNKQKGETLDSTG